MQIRQQRPTFGGAAAKSMFLILMILTIAAPAMAIKPQERQLPDFDAAGGLMITPRTASLPTPAQQAALRNLERDGDFDADVIFHEYTHGLSNRLVGGPANTDCLGIGLVGESGGMGKGWGDWYAAVFTDDAAVAEYAFGDGENGIRRFPMDNAPADFTYGSFCTGPLTIPSAIPCEVHDGGEFWSSLLWETREAMINRFHNRAYPATPFPTFTDTSAAGNIRNAQGRTFDGSGSAAQIDRAAIENGAFSALFRVTDGMKANAGPPTFTPPTGTVLLTVLADALQSQDLALTVRNPLGVVVASSDTSLTPEFAQVISVLHGTYTLTVRNKASVPAPYQLIIVPTVDLQLLSTKPGGAGGGRLMATGSSTGN